MAPFIIVYDGSGKAVAGNGYVNGVLGTPPAGVFDTSKWGAPIIGHHINNAPANEDRFSWQTADGTRIAAVLVHYETSSGGGYVLSGRNMREVEARIGADGLRVLLAWGATLAALLIVMYVLWWLVRKS